jgi:uncharacterized protein
MNDIMFTSAWATDGKLPRLRRLFWTMAGSCALGGLYAGRISRSWIRFARLDMPLPNLGDGLVGAKLVHISDMHCSPIVMEGYLRQIIRHINDEKPDFVAITGDFITGGTHYAKRVARLLSELKASGARLACLGNHDFGIYHPRGHGHMRQLPGYIARRLFDAGVHTLRNQHAIFRRGGDAIQFVGVDDMWSDDYSPDAAFAEAEKGVPTVALAHNPDSAHHMIALGAHWVLSGHTHGNAAGVSRLRDAVFPVEKKHYHAGCYDIDGGHLYVNRGLSYARRLQLNKRPEVTVFTLRRG